MIFTGSGSDKRFLALDAKTAAPVFSISAPTATFASPAVAGSLVYFATFNNQLTAIDIGSHKIVWQWQAPIVGVEAADAAAKNPIQLTNFYDDGQAYMAKKFRSSIFLSSPVLVGHTLYVGNTDGALYALE
jgi:outer membrane protein assembly factor BamB